MQNADIETSTIKFSKVQSNSTIKTILQYKYYSIDTNASDRFK